MIILDNNKRYELVYTDIVKLIEFLGLFNVKYEAVLRNQWEDVQNGITDFLIKVDEPLRKFTETERATATTFNIFRDLRISSLEARVHTPFLANLLNPRGTHLMGNLFLIGFLERVGLSSNEQPAESWRLHNINIERHLGTEFGRSDIFLHLSCNGLHYYIIIENKINAADQKNQITDYCRYLSGYGLSGAHRYVYYLTRFGTNPSQESADMKIIQSFKPKVNICNLSYQKDVFEWLSSIVESENLPVKILLTLEQYLEIIK